VNAVKSLVRATASLNVLADTRIGHQNPQLDLPSWCPDWSTGGAVVAGELTRPLWQDFHTGAEISFEGTAVLVAKGFVLGRVGAVSPVLPNSGDRRRDDDTITSWQGDFLRVLMGELPEVFAGLKRAGGGRRIPPIGVFEAMLPDLDLASEHGALSCAVLDLAVTQLLPPPGSVDDVASVADILTLVEALADPRLNYVMTMQSALPDRVLFTLDLPSSLDVGRVLKEPSDPEGRPVDYGLAWRVVEKYRHLWDSECTLCSGFEDVRGGDVVALLVGCDRPVVLREQGDGMYRYLGPAYIDALASGGASSFLATAGVDAIEFRIK
jgi:hypothetical protein